MGKKPPFVGRFKEIGRFEGLTDSQIMRICKHATYVELPANWSLMAEMTPADKAYLILRGEVSVRKRGKEIGRLGPGSTMGEVAIVRHSLRTASIVSLTPLEVLHFTREDMESLAQEIPEFRKALEETARERMASDQQRRSDPVG